jgi:hypothetical protein
MIASRRNIVRSSADRRWKLNSNAVRIASSDPCSPPTITDSSSHLAATRSMGWTSTLDAASSSASGSPSTARQIRATAGDVSRLVWKSGRTCRARRRNTCALGVSQTSRSDASIAGRSRGWRRSTSSSAWPIASRLVRSTMWLRPDD